MIYNVYKDVLLKKIFFDFEEADYSGVQGWPKNFFFLKNSFLMICNVYKDVLLKKNFFDFKWADYSGVYASILQYSR